MYKFLFSLLAATAGIVRNPSELSEAENPNNLNVIPFSDYTPNQLESHAVNIESLDPIQPDVATIFRTVFNKEKSKLCPISIETITL